MRRMGVLAAITLCCSGQALAADHEEAASAPSTITAAAGEYFSRAHDLLLQAFALTGIRYRYGGDSPASGFDCSGFVRYVFQQIGTALPRNASEISHLGRTVDKNELQPGDLVFFNTLRRPFSHVGIYLGDQRFIHAPSGGGNVEIVNMSQRYWERRYNGARRLDL
jgi:cell wall-associated NlpC family hydrolase